MKIPDAEHAIIDPAKLRSYLLNPDHRRGGPKARMLMAFGYRAENWRQLESDLRGQHLSRDYDKLRESPYGSRYEIRALITTPSGRSLALRSIWQTDTGMPAPRQITLYPD